MSESRARRKLREAVERHGMEVESITREPIRSGGEKSGPEGGWLVYVKGYGVASGYTWQETAAFIDHLAPLWPGRQRDRVKVR